MRTILKKAKVWFDERHLKADEDWHAGDRDTGYQLKRIFGFRITEKHRVDFILAKYPPGSFQPLHKDRGYYWHEYLDEDENIRGERRLWDIKRLALVLRPPEDGGKLIGSSVRSFLKGRVNYLHASHDFHQVTQIKGNKTRVALLASLFSKDAA